MPSSIIFPPGWAGQLFWVGLLSHCLSDGRSKKGVWYGVESALNTTTAWIVVYLVMGFLLIFLDMVVVQVHGA